MKIECFGSVCVYDRYYNNNIENSTFLRILEIVRFELITII